MPWRHYYAYTVEDQYRHLVPRAESQTPGKIVQKNRIDSDTILHRQDGGRFFKALPGGPGGLLSPGSHRSVRADITAYGSSNWGFAMCYEHTNGQFSGVAGYSGEVGGGTCPTSYCVPYSCD